MYMANIALSETEKRILKEITKRGMLIPENELAKTLRINPTTLHYKIKKFEDNKIITGYRYRTDYFKMGIGNLAWVFLSLKREGAEIDKSIGTLLDIPRVRRISFTTGEYDIALKIYSKNSDELYSIVDTVGKMLSGCLESIAVFNVSGRYIYHGLPVDKIDPIAALFRKEDFIDSKDRKIIDCIKRCPEITIAELAKKIKMHKNTTYKRWKNLIKKKVIVKKSVIINPDYYPDTGSSFRAFLMIDAKKGHADELAEYIAKKTENIHELDKTVFPSDLLMLMWCKDTREFYEFENRLFNDKKIGPLINKIKSYVVVEEKTKEKGIK